MKIGSFGIKVIGKPQNVPGSIHLDLLSNGDIYNPFIGTNEKDLRWISARNWDYKLTFKVEPEIFEQKYIFILFEGVDTYAEIFFNDQKFYQQTICFTRGLRMLNIF